MGNTSVLTEPALPLGEGGDPLYDAVGITLIAIGLVLAAYKDDDRL